MAGSEDFLPWQQRVVEEKEQLKERMDKLETFCNGSKPFADLPYNEQAELEEQLNVMSQYYGILCSRVNRFYNIHSQTAAKM